jgi:hypothetical protein
MCKVTQEGFCVSCGNSREGWCLERLQAETFPTTKPPALHSHYNDIAAKKAVLWKRPENKDIR